MENWFRETIVAQWAAETHARQNGSYLACAIARSAGPERKFLKLLRLELKTVLVRSGKFANRRVQSH